MEMTKSEFEEYRSRYRKAVKDGKDTFTFKGSTVVTTYAKQVVEYFKPRFNFK